MPRLVNHTPFATTHFLSLDRHGEQKLVVVAAGSFVLARPGRTATAPLRVADEQPLPATTDIYWGVPGASSLRYESQAAYVRPKTDVVVLGRAWAPRGRPAATTTVAVRVGSAVQRAIVFGARVWRQRPTLFGASHPEPFESIALSYEHAFGGAAGRGRALYEPRNPLGVGLYASDRDAVDRPLPHVEDPTALIRSVSDRPPPCGFGPVPRTFQPRLAFAGTYDATWVERRAPLWPEDFDERFFQAAPPPLQIWPRLRGGEPIVLEGMSPDGTIACSVPAQRLLARCEWGRRHERSAMNLDTVSIEPDVQRIVLVWRATFAVRRDLAAHVETTVRALEPWETAP